jgi:large conductance mechanosensitive channel
MKILREFKEFISKGNVMSLAIGVIIGSAFTGIVDSLVKDIFMPLVSLLTGGRDFSNWIIVLGKGEYAATLRYGEFIAAVINFLIISAVIFLIVKGITRVMKKNEKKEEETTKVCPYCKSEIDKKASKCAFCTSDLE